MLEYILLGFLMQGNMTGYEMKQHMSMSTSYFVDASFGSIYPSLKKLEQKKLVERSETVENGKLKKMYFINNKGKSEFMKWLVCPIKASKTDSSVALTKLFFFRYLPSDEAVSMIERYIHDTKQYKESLFKLKSRIEKKTDEFGLGTLDYGLAYYDFCIHWYESYLRDLKQKMQ